MKSSDNALPTTTPRTRITRFSVARSLSPTTDIPPFTPPPRRRVPRVNATPQHGGTPAPAITVPPTLAFANPNYYDLINNDTFDETPPEGELLTSPQNSPSLLTPPSPRKDHNPDENSPLGPLPPSTTTAVYPEGSATASALQ